ncbi:peptidase G2 autoproteolytic cleavage domain-containing protein [Phaeobacter sp. PT47_59]|uniref:peptidase G2 autoproteolytic cleavage domain-containing protein n=1 Tax=Phaeobacter sp. PT47_59 TaxID=3029979 RepID=UPI00238022A2|nr:peptidase G2 autoproteolytic cleavage domain-containing protein [Phaeobacter sp. PT47_59]MDE4175809.1 peptidase G2 autoproteolytic cleavage domain-containing protein [Phaeobacter sp. PT47_59]
MAWEKTGTVDYTQGSPIVTGTGTNWFSGLQSGWVFMGADFSLYEILTVDSATQITLAQNYRGATATDQFYAAIPTMAMAHALGASAQALLSDFQAAKDLLAGGYFGTSLAAFNTDRDTGVKLVGENQIGLQAGGVLGLLLANGAVGIGTAAGLEGSLTLADFLNIRRNADGWLLKHQRTDGSQSCGLKSFGHSSAVGLQAVTNDAVRMTLSNAGRMGMGTTDPDHYIDIRPVAYSHSQSGGIQIGSTGGQWKGGLFLASNSGGSPRMVLRVPADNAGASYDSIICNHSEMKLRTLGADRVVVDSLGKVGVGVASPTAMVHAANAGQWDIGFRASMTNAAYSSNVMRAEVTRAASSDFYFLVCQASGGADNVTLMRGDGTNTTDGTWGTTGADYAEFFEWLDGNPAGEDRRGLSVVLVGNKIRPAQQGEDPFGVVSATPSVVGDTDNDQWRGKYLRDDFGSHVWEEYETVTWTEIVTEAETVLEQATEEQVITHEVIEVVDGVAVKKTVTETVQVPLFDEFPLVDETGNPVMITRVEKMADGSENHIEVQAVHREPRMVDVVKETTKEEERSYAADEVPEGVTIPADAVRVTQRRRKLNPDFDPSQEYTPRAERVEWDTVGLMGKLRVLKGQPVGARWIKMRDISDNVEEWLVR